MAADLCLIVYTAQAHAGKLTAHALRNGVRDAGLANTRRAHKAENLSFDISVEFTNCQQFQNTLLHFLQTVMLPVQHLAGMGLVQVILGGNVPGQRQAGIQIATDDAAFGGIALHPGQAIAFFQELFGGFAVQLQGLDLFAVFLRFRTGVLGIAQALR